MVLLLPLGVGRTEEDDGEKGDGDEEADDEDFEDEDDTTPLALKLVSSPPVDDNIWREKERNGERERGGERNKETKKLWMLVYY